MSGVPPTLDVYFTVEGTAVSKGSMSGFPIARGKCTSCKPGRRCAGRSCFGGTIVGVSVTDQGGKELDAWEELTFVRAMSARNLAGMRPVLRPNACEVSIVFVMARPPGHWGKAGQLTSAGREREMPSVKPDVDKLARGLVDGITRALVTDDAQVCVLELAQVYAGWRGWTGAVVHARQCSHVPNWAGDMLLRAGVWSPPTQEALL